MLRDITPIKPAHSREILSCIIINTCYKTKQHSTILCILNVNVHITSTITSSRPRLKNLKRLLQFCCCTVRIRILGQLEDITISLVAFIIFSKQLQIICLLYEFIYLGQCKDHCSDVTHQTLHNTTSDLLFFGQECFNNLVVGGVSTQYQAEYYYTTTKM